MVRFGFSDIFASNVIQMIFDHGQFDAACGFGIGTRLASPNWRWRPFNCHFYWNASIHWKWLSLAWSSIAWKRRIWSVSFGSPLPISTTNALIHQIDLSARSHFDLCVQFRCNSGRSCQYTDRSSGPSLLVPVHGFGRQHRWRCYDRAISDCFAVNITFANLFRVIHHFRLYVPSLDSAMAMNILMLFGRFGGVVGSNIMSILLYDHCEYAFYLPGGLVAGRFIRTLYEEDAYAILST